MQLFDEHGLELYPAQLNAQLHEKLTNLWRSNAGLNWGDLVRDSFPTCDIVRVSSLTRATYCYFKTEEQRNWFLLQQ